jgi:hypothetical protein
MPTWAAEDSNLHLPVVDPTFYLHAVPWTQVGGDSAN